MRKRAEREEADAVEIFLAAGAAVEEAVGLRETSSGPAAAPLRGEDFAVIFLAARPKTRRLIFVAIYNDSMLRPIVAHHLILSAYGFWLPNDPRGSWSTTVRAEKLRPFGEATKVDTHRSVAHVEHDRHLRLTAKGALAHQPVKFDAEQRSIIGAAIGGYVVRSGLRLYACAVMPNHLHLVSALRDCSIEQTANLIKGATTTALKRAVRHPFADQTREGAALPSPWARKHWVVFLHEHDMARTIGYVRDNPVRAGLPRQEWGFVSGWEGK